MREERVFGYIPTSAIFAVLFSAQFLIRTALDWFEPTADFHTRATISTLLGIGTLLAAGFSATWRERSFGVGAASGFMTAGLAAVFSMIGVALLAGTCHDPQIMAAIRGSGGLGEAFCLPLMMVLPGVCMGFLGGVVCLAIRKAFPA